MVNAIVQNVVHLLNVKMNKITYGSDNMANKKIEAKNKQQKEAIKDMRKACTGLFSNAMLNRVEEISLFVSDEEKGYYEQSAHEGRRIFMQFLVDEIKKVYD